ncbi:4'-phosphopantetheinyl transferase [Paenibacillus rhizosphaerae]|uniref:4'-phosphopantetheinyl transferase n=1 Tax=Paenibacillus rhizosphaerae TaxID=297318 RepID=A0A839TI54_9BACL|nr:4'-phosphopantetheinyl transferase superfamily protein [Paenibacillus rhizosphaerae]MBB3126351.1 4'-phosphopantetheinyl transferase [Paenibacillus rhizosphaerae]
MIRLYMLAIKNVSAAQFDHFMKRVSPERIRQVRRIRNRRDAVRSLFGEVMVRWGVSQVKPAAAFSKPWMRSEFGKPVFADEPDIHFNLSHSGDWVVAAIGPSELGVDVEQVLPVNPGIAESCFSPAELGLLQCLPEEERLGRFYDIWTLKESYTKCIGKGLSQPLDSFTITICRDGKIEYSGPEEEARNYQFMLIPVEGPYKLAVCTKARRPIEIYEPEMDQLLGMEMFSG